MSRPRPPSRRRGLAGAVVLLVALTACSRSSDPGPSPAPAATSGSPSPAPTPTPSPTSSPTASPTASPTPDLEPVVSPIGDERWQEMVDTGSWREGCPVGRDDLRELEVAYVDFEGQTLRGTVVAHRDTVASLGRIFVKLYDDGFPIERMEPVEAFDGDTLASLQANNTSAYNCRRPDQINAPQAESPHANGRAIDINPDLNPWMDLRCDCWSPRATHQERTPAPGKILPGDDVVRLFEDEGWIWQNIDVADYMHFDTGYPSVPWSSPDD